MCSAGAVQVQLCSAYAVHAQRMCSARHLGVPQCLHHADVGAVKGLVEGRLRGKQLRRLSRRSRQRRRARARDADGDCGGGGLRRRIGDVPRCGLVELTEAVADGLQRRAEQLVPTRLPQRRAEGAPAQGESNPRAWVGLGSVVSVRVRVRVRVNIGVGVGVRLSPIHAPPPTIAIPRSLSSSSK